MSENFTGIRRSHFKIKNYKKGFSHSIKVQNCDLRKGTAGAISQISNT